MTYLKVAGLRPGYSFTHVARCSASLVATALVALGLVFSSAAAQAAANLTLASALQVGSEYAPDVVAAAESVASALRESELASADPATTPMALAAARRTVAAAEDALGVAVQTAKRDVVLAYADVLQAQTRVALADHQLRNLSVTLQATQARFAAGAVTPADVSRAENDVAGQQRTLQEAESDLDFARDALAALLGQDIGDLTPVTEADLLPDEVVEAVAAGAPEGSARVATARRNLEAAQMQLAARDNALSSRAEIEAARGAVESATEALANVEAAVVREVQRAQASVSTAANRYRGAKVAAASAASELAAQQVRLNAGTISELAYSQAELAYMNALASEASALHSLLAAQYALELAARR